MNTNTGQIAKVALQRSNLTFTLGGACEAGMEVYIRRKEKRMKKKKIRKISHLFAILLTLVLVVGLLPVSALAEDGTASETGTTTATTAVEKEKKNSSSDTKDKSDKSTSEESKATEAKKEASESASTTEKAGGASESASTTEKAGGASESASTTEKASGASESASTTEKAGGASESASTTEKASGTSESASTTESGEDASEATTETPAPLLRAAKAPTETTDISGTVYWVYANKQSTSRPQSVTLTLYADGVSTGKTTTVSGPATSGSSRNSSNQSRTYTFEDVPVYNSDGNAITYTVVQSSVSNYETTYSSDTLRITNTYTGANIANHTFNHIDVRIAGASLEINFIIKDANGKVISSTTQTLECSVIGVNSVKMNGKTYTGFSKSGTYEYRKMNLSINVTNSSTAVLDVNLQDSNGNVYNNVIINYGRGGIVSAAYNCNGYSSWAGIDYFDGLDFNVGTAQNYNIEYISTGVLIDVQKQIQSGNDTVNYTGSGDEFTFTLKEEDTGRTWTASNDESGLAEFAISYPYTSESELYAYDGKTYTYTLTETKSAAGYTDVTEEKTFTVSFKVEKTDNGATLTPTLNLESGTVNYVNEKDKTSVDVSKTWDDQDDQDGKRPKDVTVKLLADKEDTGKTLTLDKDNGWKGTFSNLDKYNGESEIAYTIEEVKVDGYTTEVTGSADKGYTIKNTHKPATTEISVSKTWDDKDDQDGKRPKDVTVKLLADKEDTGKTLTLNPNNSWTGSFTDLAKYASGKEIEYTVEEETVAGYTAKVTGTAADGYVITNSHTPETISVSGSKTWDDSDNQDGKRPEKIVIHLLADGEETASQEVTADEQGNWSWTFKNQPKYNAGKEITYRITEESIEGYTQEYSEDLLSVTNTYDPEKTSITVVKVWEDSNNQDGIRPTDVTVKLLADGEDTGKTATLNEKDSWSTTFQDLAKYAGGKEIAYTVKEVEVDGYTAKVTGTAADGYTVTNTHKPETTEISVSKGWDDNSNQDGKRPTEITVKLLADGVATGDTLTLKQDNRWIGTFTDLAKNADGKEITYTVEEEAVTGYTAKVTGTAADGYVITNSHTPETTKVSVSKVWDDNDNQDGLRKEVTVKLLADDKDTEKTLKLNQSNRWIGTFTDLDKYAAGKEIAYTVEEVEVDGYTAEVTGTAADGYVITNSHTPETTEVNVSKEWNDNDNQDGLRKEVTVKLLADGKDTKKTLKLNQSNRWIGTFTDLDKYAAGKEIAYTVEEVKVDGYTAKVTGTAAEGYVITNSHTPETIDISGSKTWDDSDNQDGKRPGKIIINLLADGEKVDSKEVKKDEQGNWSWTFTDKPKYKAGNEITYTITEDEVEGYTQSYSDDYLNVKNSYEPEKTSVNVVKVWEDSNNQDGIRPAYVTVKLLADGKDTGKEVTLNEENSWRATFTDLAKYAKGTEIEYTVEEVKADGYTAEVVESEDGFTITNTHTPETTSVSGSKTWKDNDNKESTRPESIKIHLLADGKEVDSKEVTADKDGSWSWTFDGLAKYNAGQEIVYTILEDAVKGYTTEYSKDRLSVTNTYEPKKTAVTVVKAWDDSDDKDGIRPSSVTVNLLANGVATGKTLTLSQDNSWQATFSDLARYADGKEIAYTVSEDSVDGYTAEISGTAADGYTITNRHTPEETEEVTDDPTDDDTDDTTTSTKKTSSSKKKSSSKTKTGDRTMILWNVLLILAVGCMAYYMLSRRRKGRHTGRR